MTRNQRSVHRLLWPLLALAVWLGFVLAFHWRPPPENEVKPAATEQQQ